MSRRPKASPVAVKARRLRRQATLPERLLWSRLRGAAGHSRVRRQHPIGPYVVDFSVPSVRLVVEVDGRSHDGRGAYDVRRQRYIEQAGWQVMRVSNDDVLADLDGVVDGIERAIADREI